MGRIKSGVTAVLFGLALLAGLVSPQPAAAAPRRQPSPCATAVATAIAQRGKSYVWGAKGPNAFDCSGLTRYAWVSAGYNIGLSTYDQAGAGVAIPCRMDDLVGEDECWEPGDLIFLRYTGGQHVAMYIGNSLFADAYNSDTGVIIHDVTNDSFYWDNFWQARRIVDCGGSGGASPTPDSPETILPPSLEEIPDILSSVSFVVPQCGSCNPDGSILLPAQQWGETWPSGWELLVLPQVFRITISWLSWRIGEFIRQLICWLLAMLAILAAILAAAFNTVIYGINALFKLLVLTWLSLKAYFFAFWELLESMRALLASLSFGLAGLAELGRITLEVLALIAGLLARLLALIGQMVMVFIGLIGWVGGLALGFFGVLQVALVGTDAPAQLSDTHVIYMATRGALEGLRDSQIGWFFPVIWAMVYVAFFAWLARFLPANKESA